MIKTYSSLYKTIRMIYSSEERINTYKTLTLEFIEKGEALLAEPLVDLNHKEDHETWSALEALEHLNLYGDFYIPEIREKINRSRFPSKKQFKSGVLGGYFVNILKPRTKLNKMKTFKDKNPNGSKLDLNTVARFINQQKEMLELLEDSRSVDLTKTKTAISISKWIKLRLGDTLGVVVYHNQRHMEQVENTLRRIKA